MPTTTALPPARNRARDVPQGAPPHFRSHSFERTFRVGAPREEVWAWLNDPETFTKGQIWPFRVEFVDGGMEPGVLNIHHGPLMSFTGVVGEMRRPRYRDLRYLYGSYAITLRWIRPTRLRFWLEDAGDGRTTVRLRVDSLVRRGVGWLWTALQRAFWSLFPLSARAGVRARRGKDNP